MESGIYKITNKINGKLYVGSAVNINIRWHEHRRDLLNIKHHSIHLQNAWNKYGESNFIFEIIEHCEECDLIRREQYYLDLTRCYERDRGYNISKNASAPMMGRSHSQETKRKLSESHRGINNFYFGKHHTEEIKNKIKEKRKNQIITEETKRKWSLQRKGKILNEEHKQKISDSLSGEKSYNAKLTWEQVREIRQKYIPYKYSTIKLAKEYGVSQRNIMDIINNVIWKENNINVK